MASTTSSTIQPYLNTSSVPHPRQVPISSTCRLCHRARPSQALDSVCVWVLRRRSLGKTEDNLSGRHTALPQCRLAGANIYAELGSLPEVCETH